MRNMYNQSHNRLGLRHCKSLRITKQHHWFIQKVLWGGVCYYKHENNNCNKCHLRFNNIKDLQNHVSDNHSDDIKDTIENKTNKEAEQEKCYDSRCSKCGYILYSEENIEEHMKPKLICKLCPILIQDNKNEEIGLVAPNRLHCTAYVLITCTACARPK